MSMGLSDLTFAHRDCFENVESYGVLKTVQPPHIFEDGTIVWYQHCTKCDHEKIDVEPAHIRKGRILHNHGHYGWHEVSRIHRSRTLGRTEQ